MLGSVCVVRVCSEVCFLWLLKCFSRVLVLMFGCCLISFSSFSSSFMLGRCRFWKWCLLFSVSVSDGCCSSMVIVLCIRLCLVMGWIVCCGWCCGIGVCVVWVVLFRLVSCVSCCFIRLLKVLLGICVSIGFVCFVRCVLLFSVFRLILWVSLLKKNCDSGVVCLRCLLKVLVFFLCMMVFGFLLLGRNRKKVWWLFFMCGSIDFSVF